MTTVYEYGLNNVDLLDPLLNFEDLMQIYPNQIFKFPSKNIFSDTENHSKNKDFLNHTLQEVYGILVTPHIMIVPERNYNSGKEIFPPRNPLRPSMPLTPLSYPVDLDYLHPEDLSSVPPYLSPLKDQKRFIDVIIRWFKELQRQPGGADFITLLDESEPLPGIRYPSETTDNYTERTRIEDSTYTKRRINIVIYGPGESRKGNSASPRVGSYSTTSPLPYRSDGRGTAVNITSDVYVTGVMSNGKCKLGFVSFAHECTHAYHALVGQDIPDTYKVKDDMKKYVQYRSTAGTSNKNLAYEEIMTTGGDDAKDVKADPLKKWQGYLNDMESVRKNIVKSYTDTSNPLYNYNQRYGPGGANEIQDNINMYPFWDVQGNSAFESQWDEKNFTKMFTPTIAFRKSYLNSHKSQYRYPNCSSPIRNLSSVYTDRHPTRIHNKDINGVNGKGIHLETTTKRFLKEYPI